jgi:hypothetical protein
VLPAEINDILECGTPEDGGSMFLNSGTNSVREHSDASYRIVIFMVTAVT